MKYDQFVGDVQHRARLASRGEAVRAIHATLHTLSERISGAETLDLAAQLPTEIAYYLEQDAWREPQKFTLHHFYNRVAARERMDYPKAVFHARVVMQVLSEAVSAGEMRDIRGQLPNEYDPLFQLEKQESAAAAPH